MNGLCPIEVQDRALAGLSFKQSEINSPYMTSSAKFCIAPNQIEGVLLIEPQMLGDESNWFMESFNTRDLSAAIRSNVRFVQDNQSFSEQWTLRGMHYQTQQPQGKLVSVMQESIFGVAVDMRKNRQLIVSGLALNLTQKIIG